MTRQERIELRKNHAKEAETLAFLNEYRLDQLSPFTVYPRCINCKWHIHTNCGGTRIPHRKGRATSNKHFCCMDKTVKRLDGRQARKDIPPDCPRYRVEPSYRIYFPKDTALLPGAAGIPETHSIISNYHWFSESYNKLMRKQDKGLLYWCVTRKAFLEEENTGPHRHIPQYHSAYPLLEDGRLHLRAGGSMQLKDRSVIVREDGFTTICWEYIEKNLVCVRSFNEDGIEDHPEQI